MHDTPLVRRGRGALTNVGGRYEPLTRWDVDDGWGEAPDLSSPVRTVWHKDSARSVITRNQSPDVHFDRSVNPYRGCEHGCIYCFARPSHTWLGHSAGLDFERQLYAKTDAPALLRQELARPGYRVEPIALGVNTDAWQPLERKLQITRQLLEILLECRHPVYLITKSSLIERDIDVLAPLAEAGLVTVCITLTTLDHSLARRLEPRATAPRRRLRTMATLHKAGIPVRVSISPIIPALNEMELETLVDAAAQAGAHAAHALLLRLPHELRALFCDWLEAHYPLKKARVLKAIRSLRDGALNTSEFGVRHVGEGPRAEIIQARFKRACKRAGISSSRRLITLDCSRFRPPAAGGQLSLFD